MPLGLAKVFASNDVERGAYSIKLKRMRTSAILLSIFTVLSASACASPNYLWCAPIEDQAVKEAILQGMEPILADVHATGNPESNRVAFFEERDVTFLNCPDKYVVDADLLPSQEPGVYVAGWDIEIYSRLSDFGVFGVVIGGAFVPYPYPGEWATTN